MGMKKNKRSKTAEVVATARAYHLLYQDPVVFEDPYAIQLTSLTWRIFLKIRALNWLLAKTLYHVFLPVFAEILGRACYAEEQLDKALERGIDQYVLLGAGLDSFALRRKDIAPRLKVFELDHPASQKSKRDRLTKLNINVPDNLEFVPVDFVKDSVADALARSTYSNEKPAFFSWLGTILYLSQEAVFSTLKSIKSYAKPGSEIIFDYLILKELVEADDLALYDRCERGAARRGEPLLSSFDPQTLVRDVTNLGFELVEHLSSKEQNDRYFFNRKDGLRPLSFAYFAHFRLGA
jgi:methyltransferase (TIGR00027 family)